MAANDKIRGPLTVLKKNPRYFTDDGKRAVYLTAAHTWNNLIDMGHTDPPQPFDFTAYLDLLEKTDHNFIRLWTFEMPKFMPRETGNTIFATPHPWMRTGPDQALDGKPKFDLNQLNPEYFKRLRTRVEAACARGVYVSIMLFEGWALEFPPLPDVWQCHPFHSPNNINGIEADKNGDGRGREYHTMEIPEITAIQEAYVRRVIDTVNDLDNVLYEITNESAMSYSLSWQYHMVHFVKKSESQKPKQHPVGMTGYGPCENNLLYSGPADWISPGLMTIWKNEEDPMKIDPPVNDGKKVSLLDTDHIWGLGGNRAWVWKSFLRGHNPLFMDFWPHNMPQKSLFDLSQYSADMIPQFPSARKNLGYAMTYARRIDLANMKPRNELCLSTFCLANPGKEYLCYLPKGGKTAVDLTGSPNAMVAEWFNPAKGKVEKVQKIRGGGIRELKTPFKGDAVIYVYRKK